MQHEWSVYFYKKALLVGEELYELRKEKYPLYEAILAPLYYCYGASLVNYIEANLHDDGHLKPLKFPRECTSDVQNRKPGDCGDNAEVKLPPENYRDDPEEQIIFKGQQTKKKVIYKYKDGSIRPDS